MAFDQTSVPCDLRSLNVTRAAAEEPLVPPASKPLQTAEYFPPNSVWDHVSSGAVPLVYPASVSDAGLVRIAYGNVTSAIASPTWCVRPAVPVHPTVNPAVGLNYGSGFANRFMGANAVDLLGSVVAASHGYPINLGNSVSGNGFDNALPGSSRVVGNAVHQIGGAVVPGGIGFGSSLRTDQGSNEGMNDSVSGQKMKLLCSYGGKILPRPCDGKLRYVGGQTRIISVRRGTSFNELAQKMTDTYGQPVVIKYQLPDEDLDALVSVSCPEDLDNMMEEYEKLIERSPDGSAKLRVFLFSASELDPSGVVQFVDLQDNGQKYVEAVNGIIDGISGKLTRKESIKSAASTQNSDLSVIEALDGSIAGQADVSQVPSSGMPAGNGAASQDATSNMKVPESIASVYSDAFVIPLDTSATNSGPMHNPPFHNEVELEKSVPVTLCQEEFGLQHPVKEAPPPAPNLQASDITVTNSGPNHRPPFHNELQFEKSVPVTLSQQHIGLQQPGMENPLPALYMHPLIDPFPEVMNNADFVQLPRQMGFSNPELFSKAGSIYSQHQLHENTHGLVTHQVIPAVQMTMAQSSSHAGVQSNAIQPQLLLQMQQNVLDKHSDGNTSGVRIFQLPAEHRYGAYPGQVPSVIVGGSYSWVQAPPPEHVVFPNVLLPQQTLVNPEKTQRSEDCYMCQKKLPHAHSDPVVQDQHNICAGLAPDSNPSYHSLPMNDNSKAQATNKVVVTTATPEGMVEQVVGTRPMIVGKSELGAMHYKEATVLSCNLGSEPEGERHFSQKPDNLDHQNTIVKGTIVGAGEKQLLNAGRTGTAPLPYLDDVVCQHVIPVENWAKEDVIVNKPITADMPLVGCASVETSQCTVQESAKGYTNELTSIVSKADIVENWIAKDHLKPVDLRVEPLKIINPESYADKPEVHASYDKVDHSTQCSVEKKGALDNNLSRSKLDVDANQINTMDVLPSFIMEVPYGNNSRPADYNEVAQPHVPGIPNSNPQSKEGNHKGDVFSSSTSPSVRFGDAQDSSNSLFSNQDPWNIHGSYFPPPRPKKIALEKEHYSYKDQFGENPGNSAEQNVAAPLDNGLAFKQNLALEDARSAKGSSQDQQLQAVAEGVAASVLHSSIPSNPELHARDVSFRGETEDGYVQNSEIDVQCKSTAQDVESKLPEKANFGFPITDLGALQVIKNCDLEELVELGSGTFGTVYHGKWRGTDVAIKRINDRCFAGKPSEEERLRADFWNEAIKLADLHHPNVVAFYGVVLDGPGGSVATVTEYMVNGSLRNALQKNERNLDKRKRLLIAMDVAFGMEYLHGKNIVHFDLKSDNLLVNLRDPHRPICKVGDLGLSKVKCQTLISGGVRGTLPWMAPELLNGSSSLVSEKVDVFSFGIVLWELLTGEEPYADLHYGAIIGGIVSNTLRPPVPETCDPEWRLLMERCWSSETSERPTFTEVANELRQMAAKVSPKGQNQ
ncbi:hypothetical protein HN873_044126 [Arachis hypogaea]|nr:Serine/threonine-protein kinase [Arachis hypogaea]QHO01741.1 Serine/threonine-protein kinase [Arachis hypogaea]